MITKNIISSVQLTVSQLSSMLPLLYNLDIDFFEGECSSVWIGREYFLKSTEIECILSLENCNLFIFDTDLKRTFQILSYTKIHFLQWGFANFKNLFWIQEWIPALEWACIFLKDQFYSDLFSWFQLGLFFFESWLVALKCKLFEKYWSVCSQGPLSCKVIEILWALDHEVMHQYLENC